MSIPLEMENVGQDVKCKMLDRVVIGMKENLITRKEGREIVITNKLLPIDDDLKIDSSQRIEKDKECCSEKIDSSPTKIILKEHEERMNKQKDFCSKMENNKDDWMGDWINKGVSNPKEIEWEIKQCRAVIEAFNVQIEVCDNKKHNFERRLKFLENC